jgi:uncharacterized membrane protein YdjX (TVP38/TMEM64 family)
MAEPPPPRPATWPLGLRVLLVVVIATALIAPLIVFRDQITAVFESREQVVAEVRNAGAWGPLVLILLAVTQTVIAPIPGQIVSFVAGYVYGLWPGILYSWIGQVIGTALVMGLARYAGRPVVERLVNPATLDKLDRIARGRGIGFFMLVFLIPGLPDDLMCLVAGLTPLPLRVLIPMSAILRLPGMLGSVWLGAYAESLPWPVWIVGGIIGAVLLWAMWRHGGALQERILYALAPDYAAQPPGNKLTDGAHPTDGVIDDAGR